jgi:exosortase/archaeosortase family protein
MNKEKKQFTSIFIRYALLIIIALPNFFLFYTIFTPLTLYPVYFLLNLFFNATLAGKVFSFNGIAVELIDACIAGSAYYLLLILNLSIPKIKLKKRLKMIFLSFAIFLLINVIRIFAFSIIFAGNYVWFDFAHKFFWYIGSIVFVVGIWFAEVKLFKIKEIPFFSDLKFVYKKSFREY